MWNKLKDIWLGPLHTKEFDLEDAVAIISLQNGTKFTLTRTGRISFIFMKHGPFCYTGTEEIKKELRYSKNFIECDNNEIIPVRLVNSIEITKTPKLVTESWRA